MEEVREAPPTRRDLNPPTSSLRWRLLQYSWSRTLYFPGFLRAQTRAPWPPMEWPLMDILLGSVEKFALMSLGSWRTHTHTQVS